MRALVLLLLASGCLYGGTDDPLPRNPDECAAAGGDVKTNADGSQWCDLMYHRAHVQGADAGTRD